MENKYPIQVIDLRHQVGHVFPKKIQLLEEINTNAAKVNARLIVIIIRRRQIEIISDCNKKIEVKFI